MKRPDDLELSQAQGKALIDRLEANQITSEDRRVLVKLIEVYFWLTAALRESKLSLKRLKRRLFGEGAKPREPPSGDDDGPGGDIGSTNTATPTSASAPLPSDPPAEPSARRGHGRQAAAAYSGATVVACRHDRLSVGERCPACGRGRLYRLPPGMTIRIDGNALLTALRYEVEKLRCSACGEIFTAPLPPAAGVDKYTARAQAMVALARYYLGLPFYRLQGFQCLVGVPVSDATQWDLAEQVAECTAPVFNELVRQAAQREVLYQDDTGVRILALIAENRAAQAATEQGQGVSLERRGMYTTGLVASGGGPTICLYFSGRAHAGENLAAVLAHRDPALPLPIVMSDALAANT
ncbi:MAG: transposase, partial [Gammaproteobacteria bacterium]